MPTPTKHALLSASSAHRWLECTAAPRFEEQFPDGTSEYAEEGTLAHAICELYARKHFTVYESLIDNNVWSPTAYPAGWKAVNTE